MGLLPRNGMVPCWVGQPRACCPQRDDLMAEMGWPVKEDGMAQGLE